MSQPGGKKHEEKLVLKFSDDACVAGIGTVIFLSFVLDVYDIL